MVKMTKFSGYFQSRQENHKFDQSASRSHREKMQTNIAIMSKMSEEEKQCIKALLTCCRRQTTGYDHDKQE